MMCFRTEAFLQRSGIQPLQQIKVYVQRSIQALEMLNYVKIKWDNRRCNAVTNSKNIPLKKIETLHKSFRKPCHNDFFPILQTREKSLWTISPKWLVASHMTRITATNSSLRSFTCTLFQMKLFRGQTARYGSNSPRKERETYFKRATSITNDGLWFLI